MHDESKVWRGTIANIGHIGMRDASFVTLEEKKRSYSTYFLSFPKSSASSTQSQKSAKMSAPWENPPLAPFKRLSQSAGDGSQASSEASFESAPEFLDGENETTPTT